MGQAGSCVASLDARYNSVNFIQGDQQSFFYPFVLTSASACNLNFQVTLIGPGDATYPCNDFNSNNAAAGSRLDAICDGVSREALPAGQYRLEFRDESSYDYSPDFAITKNDALDSCADSFFFPDHQDTVNFDRDDPNVLFATYGYSSYQCSAFADCFRSGACTNVPRLYLPNGLYWNDNQQFSPLPGTSASANPFDSPTTLRATYYDAVIRGTADDGNYNVAMLLSDGSATRTPSVDVTITHNTNEAPLPSSRGLRRRKRETEMCPIGHQRCAIPNSALTECLDTSSSLEACGGCPGTEESVDCTMLSDVDTMVCIAGKCQVSPEGQYILG